MSHTHDDRVAEHDPRYCAAYGCPMLGTMSTSTNGSSEWWCFAHFGKDAGMLQRLTVEINRREWLAKAITDIRTGYWSPDWPTVFKAVQHDFAMEQRNDLRYGGSDKDTTVWRWVARLEAELQAMCNATFTKPPRQERMPDLGLQRVQLDVPIPA